MAMKVGSAGTAKSVGTVRKSGGVSSSSGADFAALLEGVDDAAPASVGTTAGVGGIEALLAAQSVGDALESEGKKKRAAERGNNILDRLEDLRAALLTGKMSKQRLIELARTLREPREKGLDPRLDEILDEIELRAEVELAKLNI